MINRYFSEARKLVPDAMGLITGAILSGLAIYLGKVLTEEAKINLSDYIQFLILIFIAATMSVAIWSQRRNEKYNASKEYLENAVSLVEKAQSAIKDQSGFPKNDRVSWVTAARLITRAELIARKISEKPHLHIYDAERDYHRHQFWSFLKLEGKPLPISFFTGATDPHSAIGDAVFEPNQKKDGDNWIPPRIVSVIYRYFQYPEGYEDPLDESENLSDRERDRLWLFGQYGVCDYLTFREHFVPVRKKIFRKGVNTKAREVNAQDISNEMAHLSGTKH